MASVFLNDLDDYLAPSQACVNPVFADTTSTSKADSNGSTEPVKLSLAYEGTGGGLLLSSPPVEEVRPDLIKKAGTKATVSLNDCLACSGCVTSAETVLISQQSSEELRRVFRTRRFRTHALKAAAFVVSPQSLASLAVHFSIPSLHDTFRCLRGFLQSWAQHEAGIGMVDPLPVYLYDMSLGEDISLLESAAEFVERYRKATKPSWDATPRTSRALSSTSIQYDDEPSPLQVQGGDGASTYDTIPMLASSCPGWVCYAEKTSPGALPYISTAKSPQQVMGTLIKQVLAPASGVGHGEVGVFGIAQCYDKKLEASRQDFFHEDWDMNETDLVLAVAEVLDMLREHSTSGSNGGISDGSEDEKAREAFLSYGADAMQCDHSEGRGVLDLAEVATYWEDRGDMTVAGPEATEGEKHLGSGGYLDFIFRVAALELWGQELGPSQPLVYVQGRNADFQEVALEVDGQVKLQFAQAYGFRNIQGVIAKLKRSKCPYHFIEVMACPSGCLGGGGLIRKPSETPAESKARVTSLSDTFHARPRRDPRQNALVARLYRENVCGGIFSTRARALFHTRYHAVRKLELLNPAVTKW